MKSPIDIMLDEIDNAIGNCRASEREVMEALVDKAEFWRDRLHELEAEDGDED